MFSIIRKLPLTSVEFRWLRWSFRFSQWSLEMGGIEQLSSITFVSLLLCLSLLFIDVLLVFFLLPLRFLRMAFEFSNSWLNVFNVMSLSISWIKVRSQSIIHLNSIDQWCVLFIFTAVVSTTVDRLGDAKDQVKSDAMKTSSSPSFSLGSWSGEKSSCKIDEKIQHTSESSWRCPSESHWKFVAYLGFDAIRMLWS